ncbi:phage tail protein [Pasteurellaceae bacterium Pebbles2]|nr:phage tail protein [Pasteurellaceae bacterium Pebbles2]
MTKTFTWLPQWNMKRNRQPDVLTIDFGNGYQQRIPKGLNNDLRTFDLTFKSNEIIAKEIDDFLAEHCGVKAFLWTPYGEKQGRFICSEWQKEISTGFCIITTSFKEVVF